VVLLGLVSVVTDLLTMSDDEERSHVEPMVLSTPPRLAGGQFGVDIIPTPLRNNVARVRDRDNPHFNREETVNGLTVYMYNPMGPFTVDFPVTEIDTLISVSHDGPVWNDNDNAHHRASKHLPEASSAGCSSTLCTCI